MNDPSSWMEMQQQFQRLWRTVLDQSDSEAGDGGVGGFCSKLGASPSAAGPQAFSQWLNQSLQDLLRSSTAGNFTGMQDFFRAPLQGWPFAFGDNANPFSTINFSPMAPSEFATLKDFPPLGINREWELRMREVREAYTAQVNAANTLGRQLASVLTTAMQRFQQAINGNNDDDGEITSLRELYDLWVSIAEKAYAEKVMTAEYAQAFGKCINTSARARKASQELTNEVQQAMNLPNRREMDSIIEQQHSLQAQMRSLSAKLVGDSDLESLNARVETLTQQLAELSLPVAKKSEPADNKKPAKTTATASSITTAGRVKRQRPITKRSGKRSKPAPRSVNEFDIGSIASTANRPEK